MFQFQFAYTLEDLTALSRVVAKTYRRRRMLINRIFLALMAVAYLILGGLLFSIGKAVQGIVTMAFGVLLAALCLFYHRWIARRSRRSLMEGSGVNTVTLEEERISDKNEKAESTYPYSSIIGAYHYQERYFLFVDKRHALVLPERSLTQGDADSLRSFLEDKIGKTVVELR